MEAMGEFSENDGSERMSMRNSLLVWVSGAVLGWVVAVIAVYSALRTDEDTIIVQEPVQRPSIAREAPRELDAIEPAFGDDDVDQTNRP